MSKKAGTRSIDTLRTLSHLTLTCYVESIVQQFHSTIHDNLTPGWNGSTVAVFSPERDCLWSYPVEEAVATFLGGRIQVFPEGYFDE